MNKAKIKDIYYGLKNISIVKKEDFVEFVWFLVDSNEISQIEYLQEIHILGSIVYLCSWKYQKSSIKPYSKYKIYYIRGLHFQKLLRWVISNFLFMTKQIIFTKEIILFQAVA